MKPALTREEWASAARHPWPDFKYDVIFGSGGRHAHAALALYGQPFGFTWEDVDDEHLSYVLAVKDARHAQDAGDEARRLAAVALAERCIARAERIAALLPPRD